MEGAVRRVRVRRVSVEHVATADVTVGVLHHRHRFDMYSTKGVVDEGANAVYRRPTRKLPEVGLVLVVDVLYHVLQPGHDALESIGVRGQAGGGEGRQHLALKVQVAALAVKVVDDSVGVHSSNY